MPPVKIYTLNEMRSAAANSNPKMMAMLFQAVAQIEELTKRLEAASKK